MKRILIPLISAIAICSCRGLQEPIVTSPDETFTVSAEPYEGEFQNAYTRSAYFNDMSHKVTDFNIWVYDSVTGNLVNGNSHYKTYFTNPNDVNGHYLFPDFSKKYDIFMISNLGKIDVPKTSKEASSYRYIFDSYDTFKTKGFPMANRFSFVPSAPSTNHNLQLRRLVSKFSVKFRFGEDNNYDFILKSAVVRNSARVISPFADESKANDGSEVFQAVDRLSPADLLSGGGDIYMIENIQGEIFRDPVNRSADNMYKIYRECTSFLEFSGELKKKDGISGFRTVRSRYYFGEGKFAGVKRNYSTPLIITMTNTFLDNDNWTVEPMDPYTKAGIRFSHVVPVAPAIEGVSSLAVNRSNREFIIFGRPIVDNAFDDNIKYKYVFDKEALKRAGVTLKVFYPVDGGLKSSKEYGKGTSKLVFSTGDISHADSDIEFTAVDEYGAVLGKFTARIWFEGRVRDISILDSDRILYYRSRNNAMPNMLGKTLRIKLNVLPIKHESDIVISNIIRGDRATFVVDNEKNELVVTPRQLGNVGITLSADGRKFDFTFTIKQKVTLSVFDRDYKLCVRCNEWPLRKIKMYVGGYLEGSVQVDEKGTFRTYEESGDFRDDNLTISSYGFYYPCSEKISDVIDRIRDSGPYPSWEMINAENTYGWVNFYMYPSNLSLHCEASCDDGVVDSIQCIETKILYSFSSIGSNAYFNYAPYKFITWNYGFGGYYGRARVTVK